ncbi:DUF87 domain-containing protein [Vibrio sp. SCSIO 43137]|uniref:DUF87 domain-containing protein n=1 Tax=Vibrio sp. SCSIO 43137 TaxID=3021011 RepID=UPI0023071EE4|nr:DUF87 domain-containing protein [Vibrio sp. SCSIO 43137]WCE31106.1 DUF87 domain-containing protein [Vibrio sp. SCSIO 43137]
MTKVDTTLRCEHVYVIGASGSGKSYQVKQRIKSFKRVLIWDPDDEYGAMPGIKTTHLASELMDFIASGDGIYRFVPKTMDSKMLCKCFGFISLAAFVWGKCAFVGEEIADVTSASKAASGWGVVLRRGRKRGVTVFAVTQRPAEADKTVFTQAAKIWSGRLDGEGDIARVAANMRIDPQLISSLGELEFFELDRRTGELKGGYKGKGIIVRENWNAPLIVNGFTKRKGG